MVTFRARLLLALALLCASCAKPSAVPFYAAGASLSEMRLADQFDVEHAIDTRVRLVLFSRDMDGGKLIREFLAEGGAAFLESRRAAYVVDISGMPTLIARTIAIPRMRDRPYPALLDRDGSATAGFPAKPGSATLLFLDALRVGEIRYAATPGELREALVE